MIIETIAKWLEEEGETVEPAYRTVRLPSRRLTIMVDPNGNLVVSRPRLCYFSNPRLAGMMDKNSRATGIPDEKGQHSTFILSSAPELDRMLAHIRSCPVQRPAAEEVEEEERRNKDDGRCSTHTLLMKMFAARLAKP